MNIVVGLPFLQGAIGGVVVAFILTLVGGVVSHFFSCGGLGSVGEELTLESFLRNLKKPALFFGCIGGVAGIIVSNVRAFFS